MTFTTCRDNDTVGPIAVRVLAREYKLYVETLQNMSEGEIDLPLD